MECGIEFLGKDDKLILTRGDFSRHCWKSWELKCKFRIITGNSSVKTSVLGSVDR